MTDLKPCPFCGAKATLQPFFHGLSYSWGVVCSETFAHHITFGGTQEEVIKEWNRRATGPKSLHDTMKRYREKCGEPVVDDRTVE